MTKKQKILNLFNSIDWEPHHEGKRIKIITGREFTDVGLYGDIENSQQHCDLIYARRILQKMGHRVIIGGAFFVWEEDF